MENTTEAHYTTHAEYKAGVMIWKVVPPFLILFGTIGNTLSVLVLTRKGIRNSTTALYLTFLAVSDLLVLYTGLLRQWLNYLVSYDIRHHSEAACKIHLWLVYTTLDFSAWILMAVTLERVLATWRPMRAKTICSRVTATVIIIAMLILLLALNSHFVYGMINKDDVDEAGRVIGVRRCQAVNSRYVDFFISIWPWIDLGSFCVIPCTVIVVGDFSILCTVIKSHRRTSSRTSLPRISRSSSTQSEGHKYSSLTVMLLVLNSAFLITTLPISIYNIGYPHWLPDASQNTIASIEFWWAVVNMLMYTNNAINFLLYCLSGTRFRREVANMFCPKTRQCRDDVFLETFTKVETSLTIPPASCTPPFNKPSRTGTRL